MRSALLCRILISVCATAVVIDVLGGLFRISQGQDGNALWDFGLAVFNSAILGVNWHNLSRLRGRP